MAGSEISDAARSQLESAAVAVDQPPDETGPKFDTINSVEFESTEANCAAPGQVAAVVDLDLLKERFAIEEQAKKAFDEEEAKPVIVGIINSGLSEVGNTYFKSKFFAPNGKEFEKQADKDDDQNGFKDDVYGINFNTRNGEIRPYATSGDMKPHGTKMAALILGGPAVMSGWSDARPRPITKLKVVNFASSTKIGVNVDPPYLGDAIRYLADQGAQIVNIESLRLSRYGSLDLRD